MASCCSCCASAGAIAMSASEIGCVLVGWRRLLGTGATGGGGSGRFLPVGAAAASAPVAESLPAPAPLLSAFSEIASRCSFDALCAAAAAAFGDCCGAERGIGGGGRAATAPAAGFVEGARECAGDAGALGGEMLTPLPVDSSGTAEGARECGGGGRAAAAVTPVVALADGARECAGEGEFIAIAAAPLPLPLPLPWLPLDVGEEGADSDDCDGGELSRCWAARVFLRVSSASLSRSMNIKNHLLPRERTARGS